MKRSAQCVRVTAKYYTTNVLIKSLLREPGSGLGCPARESDSKSIIRAFPALLCLLTPDLTFGHDSVNVRTRIHAQAGRHIFQYRSSLHHQKCRPV